MCDSTAIGPSSCRACWDHSTRGHGVVWGLGCLKNWAEEFGIKSHQKSKHTPILEVPKRVWIDMIASRCFKPEYSISFSTKTLFLYVALWPRTCSYQLIMIHLYPLATILTTSLTKTSLTTRVPSHTSLVPQKGTRQSRGDLGCSRVGTQGCEHGTSIGLN